ncbi:MAG: acyl CoA:acetate/3-ketoacid CoA transferase [Candidatus Hydrogenedentes bacterium]|nr:acyl CoA:acetate/3-ketoacid CoA transferase [Candidatus Hydrogenedentota bacterium]
MAKVVTADEVVKMIPDGATVLIVPMPSEEIYPAFARIYEQTGHPKDLTMVWAAGLGPLSEEPKGMNHFAVPGMVKRIIAGHCGLNHKILKFIASNQVEAYNIPQGTLCQLYREIAAGRPGLLTTVGLGTFVDPRYGGGKANERTKNCEDLSQLVVLNGKEYIFYKSFKCDVGIIRGTTADPYGNITTEREALIMEILEGAMAVKNSGGFVVAQVERLSDKPAKPCEVKVPGVFVDYVVVASSPESHPQTLFVQFDPSYCGDSYANLENELSIMPLNFEKVIARRAFLELKPGMIINLGFGIPTGIARVAYEEGIFDKIKMTTEIGVIGGVPESGRNFGPAKNPEAFLSQSAMFDFYDGGGLDATCVGMAQVDPEGNVNVSKVGPIAIGPGGFINLTQSAKKLVFCGEFTAKGAKIEISEGRVVITQEGTVKKFIKSVEQITFSGKFAISNKRDVTYVTERCVFKLVPEGLLLTEIAPGIDLQKDILNLMDFRPIVPGEVKVMDERIFREGKMNISI